MPIGSSIRYLDRKEQIRRELLKCAKSRPMEFPNYETFGPRVGIPRQGPWKPVLDIMSAEETSRRLPDITFLLRNKRTGFPGQIGFVRARKPTDAQKLLAREKIQEVIDKYNPGTPNPY